MWLELIITLAVGGIITCFIALYFYNKHIKYYNKTLENVYLGNGFSNDEIKQYKSQT